MITPFSFSPSLILLKNIANITRGTRRVLRIQLIQKLPRTMKDRPISRLMEIATQWNTEFCPDKSKRKGTQRNNVPPTIYTAEDRKLPIPHGHVVCIDGASFAASSLIAHKNVTKNHWLNCMAIVASTTVTGKLVEIGVG